VTFSMQEGVGFLNVAAAPGESLVTLRRVSVRHANSFFPVFVGGRGMGNATIGGLRVEDLSVADAEARAWLMMEADSNATQWGTLGGTVNVQNPHGCWEQMDGASCAGRPCSQWFAVNCSRTATPLKTDHLEPQDTTHIQIMTWYLSAEEDGNASSRGHHYIDSVVGSSNVQMCCESAPASPTRLRMLSAVSPCQTHTVRGST